MMLEKLPKYMHAFLITLFCITEHKSEQRISVDNCQEAIIVVRP